ncbi:MAG TPA: HEAT repeat domain-containing protein [Terriglobales bacterium]|nr:HEAT repeat domain-containing protein [Terriglobales bacterium]
MKLLTAILLISALVAGAQAQQPRLKNGRVETRSAAAGLEKELAAIEREQKGATWAGYAVPVIAGRHDMCCFDSYHDYRRDPQCCGGCRLEGNGGMVMGQVSACDHLEPSQEFFVLLRLEQGKVQKVRAFSANCALDAGGLALYWLTDVRPAESVALLASLLEGERRRDLAEEAMAALAMHADPGATEALIRVARQGPGTELRGQALFWLAQKAGNKVAGVITEAIERDPDTELKKKAVFALSNMPNNQGVPLLIGLVKNNRNPVVRKEAMFWLGQSDDPRAMEFIISILER